MVKKQGGLLNYGQNPKINKQYKVEWRSIVLTKMEACMYAYPVVLVATIVRSIFCMVDKNNWRYTSVLSHLHVLSYCCVKSDNSEWKT